MCKMNVMLLIAVMTTIAFIAMPWEINAPASAGIFDVEKNPHHIIISQGETSDKITISWKGESDEAKQVKITDEEGNVMTSETVCTPVFKNTYFRCEAEFAEIKPQRKYTVSLGGRVHFTWETPEEDGKTTFIYTGDIQGGYGSWGEMIELAAGKTPGLDFVQTGGDMVNRAVSRKQWEAFLGSSNLFMSVPLMAAAGNHEGESSNNTYKKIFALAENGPDLPELKEGFYFYDHGVCRIIVMDSSFLTAERQEELGDRWIKCERAIEAWLEQTLEESTAVWNIVVTHHPPYGMHDFDTVSPQIRQLWTPLMEEGDVDLVLSGHQHMYMRTNKIKGITYIMGNAGNRESAFYRGYNMPLYAESADSAAPNYQVIRADNSKLSIVSKTKTGLVIDKAVIRKPLQFHIFEFFSSNQVVVESAQVNEIE